MTAKRLRSGYDLYPSRLTALSECSKEFDNMAYFTLTAGADTVVGSAAYDTIHARRSMPGIV